MRTDIFKLHSLIVDDYKSYIQSFININDPEIREVVENDLGKGKLWPEPLIQFNPAFETYGEVSELVDNGVLATQLSDVFRDMNKGEFVEPTMVQRAGNTEEDVNEKAEEVFRHVYSAYPELPSPFYATP